MTKKVESALDLLAHRRRHNSSLSWFQRKQTKSEKSFLEKDNDCVALPSSSETTWVIKLTQEFGGLHLWAHLSRLSTIGFWSVSELQFHSRDLHLHLQCAREAWRRPCWVSENMPRSGSKYFSQVVGVRIREPVSLCLHLIERPVSIGSGPMFVEQVIYRENAQSFSWDVAAFCSLL